VADLESLVKQDIFHYRNGIVGVDFFDNHGFSSDQLEAQGGIAHFHLQHAAMDGDALGLAGAQFADVFRPFVQNRSFSIKLLSARFVHELQGQFPDRVFVAVFHNFAIGLQR